jgi:hypothetical protein
MDDKLAQVQVEKLAKKKTVLFHFQFRPTFHCSLFTFHTKFDNSAPRWRSKGAMDRHPGGTPLEGCYGKKMSILLPCPMLQA